MLSNEWGEKSINTKWTKLFEAEKDTDLTPDKGFDTVKGFWPIDKHQGIVTLMYLTNQKPRSWLKGKIVEKGGNSAIRRPEVKAQIKAFLTVTDDTITIELRVILKRGHEIFKQCHCFVKER